MEKPVDMLVWLPQKGDELVKSKFSALTVRQDRIRAVKKFSEKMNITSR